MTDPQSIDLDNLPALLGPEAYRDFVSPTCDPVWHEDLLSVTGASLGRACVHTMTSKDDDFCVKWARRFHAAVHQLDWGWKVQEEGDAIHYLDGAAALMGSHAKGLLHGQVFDGCIGFQLSPWMPVSRQPDSLKWTHNCLGNRVVLLINPYINPTLYAATKNLVSDT